MASVIAGLSRRQRTGGALPVHFWGKLPTATHTLATVRGLESWLLDGEAEEGGGCAVDELEKVGGDVERARDRNAWPMLPQST